MWKEWSQLFFFYFHQPFYPYRNYGEYFKLLNVNPEKIVKRLAGPTGIVEGLRTDWMLLHRIFPKLTAKLICRCYWLIISSGRDRWAVEKNTKETKMDSISALNSKATKRNCHSGNNEGNIGCK